jgi:hypothetical protein
MERVRRARAVGRGIGERLDDLQLLDDRPGPPVRDDQRQRVLVLGTHVDEVDVQPVDLGHELRKVVQSRLALAPVVAAFPVPREFLHHRQPHALRVVGDRLLLGPPRRRDPPAEFGDRLIRETDTEGADFSFAGHRTCSLPGWLAWRRKGWAGRLGPGGAGIGLPPRPAARLVLPHDRAGRARRARDPTGRYRGPAAQLVLVVGELGFPDPEPVWWVGFRLKEMETHGPVAIGGPVCVFRGSGTGMGAVRETGLGGCSSSCWRADRRVCC